MSKQNLDKPSTSTKQSSSSSISPREDDDIEIQAALLAQCEAGRRPKSTVPKQLCEFYKTTRENREKSIEESRRSNSSSDEDMPRASYRRRSPRYSTTPPTTDTDMCSKQKKTDETDDSEAAGTVTYWLSSTTDSKEYKKWSTVQKFHPESANQDKHIKLKNFRKRTAKRSITKSAGMPAEKLQCLECESSDCSSELSTETNKQADMKSEEAQANEPKNNE